MTPADPPPSSDADSPEPAAAGLDRWTGPYGSALVGGIALIFAVLAGSSLGAHFANPDEGIYYRIATEPAFADAWEAIQQNAHPPLFYLLARALAGIAGPDLALLRGLSLVWAVFALVGIHRLGRTVGGPTAGVLAAALLAVSPAFFLQAQVLRPYTMLLAALCWGLYYLARFLADDGRRAHAIGFSACFTLAGLAHYGSFIAFGGVGLALAGAVATGKLRGAKLKTVAIAHAPFALLVVLLFFLHIVPRLEGSDLQADAHDRWLARFFLDGVGAAPQAIVYLAAYLLGLGLTAVTLVGFVHGLAIAGATKRLGVVVVPLATLATGVVLSLTGHFPFGGTRHALYALPYFAVPIAVGLGHWLDRGLRPAAIAAAATIGIVLAGRPLTDAFGIERDLRAIDVGSQPYLNMVEQLTPIDAASELRGWLDRLRDSDGFVLMSEQSYLTLLPMLRDEFTELEHRVDERYWTFRWGRRRVFAHQAWELGGNPQEIDDADHFASVVHRLEKTELGRGIAQRDDLGLVFSGWPQELSRVLLGMDRQRPPTAKWCRDVVTARGWVGFVFAARAFYGQVGPMLRQLDARRR